MVKVQRNSKCPCGSNLKYKKCCAKHSSISSEIKMSEIILELSQEFLEDAETDEEIEGIISLTIIAWNLSVLTKHGKQIDSELDDLLPKYTDDMKVLNKLKKIIYLLIEKKSRKYNSTNRFIINYQIDNKEENLNLNIISTIISDKDLNKSVISTK